MDYHARMTQARIFRLVIPVDDIDAAADFYRTALDDPGERVWTNRHYFRCGDVVLACVEPGEAERDFRPTADPRILYFAVDDLDAAHRRIGQARPARVDEEFGEMPWGERSFYAEDPFGNRLCFVKADTVYLGGEFTE